MKKILLHCLSISILLILTIFISCQKEISCWECPTNIAPIANAGGDQLITFPTDSLRLDGSASTDPDGTITEWIWTKISGPASFTFSNSTVSKPIVKNLVQGIYQFQLFVKDNDGLSATDTVQINVTNINQPNQPPVARAGSDQAITLPISTVLLDGSNSTDPDNNISSYFWSKISGPASFNIAASNGMQTQVTSLIEGVYEFELIVTDGGSLFDRDTVQIWVKSAVALPSCVFPFATPVATLPIARTEMASAICNNKILIAGGAVDGIITNIVDIFDPATNTVTSSNLSIARYGIAGIGIATKAFFAGGFTMNGWSNPVSRIDIYDGLTNSWSTAELSIPRAYMAVGVVGNKVFFAGGLTGSQTVTSRIDIFDIPTNTWSTAELSEARGDFAAAVTGNKIIFAGGKTNTGQGSSQRVDIFDAGINTWSTANLNSPKIGVTAIALNGKVYFTGSNYGLLSSEVDVFDSNNNSWSVLQLSEGKVWIPLGISNNKIAFIGGMLSWYNHSKKIEIYDPATNTFSYTYMTSDLFWERIVSYNNYIYSFGGATDSGVNAIALICKFQL